jgi:hypothetical protein
MPAERLKVRCYRCNQLLAVAPTKAGTIVACPKCQAELLIPSPESPPRGDGASSPGPAASKSVSPRVEASAAASSSPSPAGERPSFLEEIAAVIPPDVAALRPEDLRVEAEFFESLTRPPPATASPEPFPLAPSYTPEPLPPPEASSPFTPTGGLVFTPEAFAVNAAPVETPPPIPAPSPVLDIPPIAIEPPTILSPGAEVRRVREVVLPASVVLAWSLFVLAAVAMSFIAGLMIGHFLWRNVP